MLIKWICERGAANDIIRDEIEVDDNATDDEIEEIVREEVFNHISWSWEKGGE